MSEGFQFMDIIFLAMVAGFIALRLRGVLGRRTGHERPPHEADPRRRYETDGAEDKVVPFDPNNERGQDLGLEEESPLRSAITRIMVADRSFSVDQFLEGATAAYRMIVMAFADGDKQALRALLADDVYRNFAATIDKRENAGQTATADIEGNTEVEMEGAALDDGVAKITVKFVSRLIRVTRDEEGAVVDGHPTIPREITDIWAFERDTTNRDPNWLLVSTRGAD
jgi:predicted lipid-binding transport protein (Tim44 family)